MQTIVIRREAGYPAKMIGGHLRGEDGPHMDHQAQVIQNEAHPIITGGHESATPPRQLKQRIVQFDVVAGYFSGNASTINSVLPGTPG